MTILHALELHSFQQKPFVSNDAYFRETNMASSRLILRRDYRMRAMYILKTSANRVTEERDTGLAARGTQANIWNPEDF
jgi:hypothetical protein